jgi:hypothetical protein
MPANAPENGPVGCKELGAGTFDDLWLWPPPPLPPEPDETQVTLKLEGAGLAASLSADVVALGDPVLVTMSI